MTFTFLNHNNAFFYIISLTEEDPAVDYETQSKEDAVSYVKVSYKVTYARGFEFKPITTWTVDGQPLELKIPKPNTEDDIVTYNYTFNFLPTKSQISLEGTTVFKLIQDNDEKCASNEVAYINKNTLEIKIIGLYK